MVEIAQNNSAWTSNYKKKTTIKNNLHENDSLLVQHYLKTAFYKVTYTGQDFLMLILGFCFLS